MLIQFSVGNYLSFKDPITFSMVASPRGELEDTNVFKATDKLQLLKSAVIYGANASGKSNLFKAIRFARKFIFTSSKESQATEAIKITNFRLSTETENKPSFFEFIFIHENIKYRYGFEVDRTEVHREWLFYTPTIREALLFAREKDSFQIGTSFKEGKPFTGKTRKNALFLSVVAQWNGPTAEKILKWFKSFNVISGLDDRRYLNYTLRKIEEDQNFKKEVLEFLRIADIGIEDFDVEQREIHLQELPKQLVERMLKDEMPLPDKVVNIELKTIHNKFDKEGKISSQEKFELGSEESEGTKKLFAISGPILDTLKDGKILAMDELDSRLHPLLSNFLIKLFNSNIKNSSNAQLIFASHDASFLKKEVFRRDQVWFAEKDQYGATNLYSLVEYKKEAGKVRKDASFSKDYLLGKYGAIPNIKESNLIF
ncbi:MAG: ATP-binding protein [Candidatus Omnitrophica bacterium]|nr:ATP-binding protein [Candidatus Omnitrophota bacterium]